MSIPAIQKNKKTAAIITTEAGIKTIGILNSPPVIPEFGQAKYSRYVYGKDGAYSRYCTSRRREIRRWKNGARIKTFLVRGVYEFHLNDVIRQETVSAGTAGVSPTRRTRLPLNVIRNTGEKCFAGFTRSRPHSRPQEAGSEYVLFPREIPSSPAPAEKSSLRQPHRVQVRAGVERCRLRALATHRGDAPVILRRARQSFQRQGESFLSRVLSHQYSNT